MNEKYIPDGTEKLNSKIETYLTKAQKSGLLSEREYIILLQKFIFKKTNEETAKELNLSLNHFLIVKKRAETKWDLIKDSIDNLKTDYNYTLYNLETPVSKLDFSRLVQKFLKSIGIETMNDLCKKSSKELLFEKRCTKKILLEIEEMLLELNLKLKED